MFMCVLCVVYYCLMCVLCVFDLFHVHPCKWVLNFMEYVCVCYLLGYVLLYVLVELNACVCKKMSVLYKN
jgi:hypothetical protein